jgi:hypothetical protein
MAMLLGRPWRRLEYNIKIDLKNIRLENVN